MNKRSPGNLSKQLLIAFGFSLLIVGMGTLWINYYTLRQNLHQEVQQRAVAITQGLEFATEGAIELQEPTLLNRIVQNYATLPTVLEVAIVDPQGNVLAHSDQSLRQTQYASVRPAIGAVLQKTTRQGVGIHLRTLLKNKQAIVQILPFSSSLFGTSGQRGAAIAVLDLEQLEQSAWRNFLSATLTMSLAMGAILIFLGWLIQRLVLRPLGLISRAVKRNEHAALLQSQALPNNEVGFLGETLALAFDQLTEYQQFELKAAERKRAEMSELVDIATEATRLKDEFLANMSHELRTPLNAILGMSESLLEDVYGVLTERQRSSIATIFRSGDHLLALINDILDISKIEAGKFELSLSTVAIEQLCQSSVNFVKQQATQKSIQLTTHFAANLGTVQIDERRMRQVLINLLSNAVKFTPSGGQVGLVVSLDQSTMPVSLLFAITDTGIGIADSDLHKLFKPFSQINGSLNRQFDGTGLGLALVKQIVELHGGLITVQSKVNQGSCFTVKLPCDETVISLSSDPLTSIEIEQTTTSITALSPVILLVEDNIANINVVSGYLSAKGYQVLVAQNGQEAIDLTYSDHPDLILMDIQMPGMNGLEAIRQLRLDSNLQSLPIIALTALAMNGDREKCLQAGANEYISKPMKLQELTIMIQQFLVHPHSLN